MAGFSQRVHIARSPDDVFSFMTDPGNASKIMPDIVSYEQQGDGEVGVGTVYRETRKMGKKTCTADITVTEYEPARAYAASSSQMGIDATYRYTLAPDGDGTKIDLDATVTGRGLSKLLIPLIMGAIKKSDGDHLQRMKTLIEST